MTFFLDRQLGRHKLSGILRDAHVNVEIHDFHFTQDAPDEEWLMMAGQKGWIVVTRDERVRYRVAEKQAIRAFVIVARGHLRIEAIADIFLKALPQVRPTTTSEEPPFIAKIWRDGSVEVIGG